MQSLLNVLDIAKEKNQRGITLLETMLAMVITASIILPAFGFLTLAMEEQVNARTLTAETSNIAAVDLDLVRDVTNAKAAVASTAANGSQRPIGDLRDCEGGESVNGAVALAMIDSRNWRIVYSLKGDSSSSTGGELWRRECPNQSQSTDATLADPVKLNSGDGSNTIEQKVGLRLKSAVGSCPKNPAGQDVSCRNVKLILQSVDRSKNGAARPPVVLQATRRTDSYAVPGTPPIARFSYAPSNVEDLDLVQFDGSGSRDQRGGDLEYRWEFGAPVSTAIPYSSNPTPPAVLIDERNAAAVPDMEVTLTVRNDQGSEASVTKPIVLNSKPPTAVITSALPVIATVGQTVSLEAVLKSYSTAKIIETTGG